MHIEKPAEKERSNKQKHKVGFALADLIFADWLSITVYDRHENGEDRWHIFGAVQGTVFLVVHTFPDPDDGQWIRVVGLRKATALERRRYEEAIAD